MPRFVLLSHDWPVPHLDLLIERDGVLKAWRLPPDFAPPLPCLAEANFDHRLPYLDYAGPVSGGRGVVARHDGGDATWEAVDAERVVVTFGGELLRGRWELRHESGTAWRFRSAE